MAQLAQAAERTPAMLEAFARASPYTSCYCEENVWRLVESLDDDGCFAVFVSNAARCCPIWHQRAAQAPRAPVLWDYHVFLVARAAGRYYVVDRDTTLGLATLAVDYVDAALRPTLRVAAPPELSPAATRVRVVGARDLLHFFASDRRHMLDERGAYQSPPPPQPPIRGPGAVDDWNLGDFWDVVADFPRGRGVAMDVPAFRDFLARGP